MNIRPYRQIERRKSRKIKVGSIFVGGDAPITVQTMTNTKMLSESGITMLVFAFGCIILGKLKLDSNIKETIHLNFKFRLCGRINFTSSY